MRRLNLSEFHRWCIYNPDGINGEGIRVAVVAPGEDILGDLNWSSKLSLEVSREIMSSERRLWGGEIEPVKFDSFWDHKIIWNW